MLAATGDHAVTDGFRQRAEPAAPSAPVDATAEARP